MGDREMRRRGGSRVEEGGMNREGGRGKGGRGQVGGEGGKVRERRVGDRGVMDE